MKPCDSPQTVTGPLPLTPESCILAMLRSETNDHHFNLYGC